MTEALLTLKHKDGTIAKVYQDESPETPREWDNLGTIKTWSRHYDFSDKHAPNLYSSDDFEDWAKEHDVEIMMRLDISDYGSSGLKISIDEEADLQTHSGGVIFVTKDQLLKEFPQKTLTGNICSSSVRKAKDILKAEIKTLQEWANGEVYGYNIERPVTCKTCKHVEPENVDSCWGYYGVDAVKEELESRGYKA